MWSEGPSQGQFPGFRHPLRHPSSKSGQHGTPVPTPRVAGGSTRGSSPTNQKPAFFSAPPFATSRDPILQELLWAVELFPPLPRVPWAPAPPRAFVRRSRLGQSVPWRRRSELLQAGAALGTRRSPCPPPNGALPAPCPPPAALPSPPSGSCAALRSASRGEYPGCRARAGRRRRGGRENEVGAASSGCVAPGCPRPEAHAAVRAACARLRRLGARPPGVRAAAGGRRAQLCASRAAGWACACARGGDGARDWAGCEGSPPPRRRGLGSGWGRVAAALAGAQARRAAATDC